MIIPKTLRDALEDGYIIGECEHERGYLSRKVCDLDQPVKVDGRTRSGQLYVELPCHTSSTYHYRFYLVKPIDK